MNKDLEYILNFDENKLFNTKIDDENTNKVKTRASIKEAKRKYYERLEKASKLMNVVRAFDFCGIRYTNTPHEGLMHCIKNVLRYSDYLWLLEYTANELRKLEE